MNTDWIWLLIVVAAGVITVLPPHIDPAIRFKELMDKWRK